MAATLQSGPGIPLTTKPLVGNEGSLSLPAGQTFLVPPGQYYIDPGPYNQVQFLCPVTGLWRGVTGVGTEKMTFVNSDGVNVRVANLTGCAIGAFVTNVGSGYTSAPTVTASAGGSLWRAIVGGAVSTTVTVNAGGSGYLYPPQIIFDAPPPGGIPATATATLTGGAISGITVVNQGAGYRSVPNITIVPDARDLTGSGARLTATLTGAGTITAVVCTDHGTPVTAVPTLAFAGGGGASAAATAVMCFAVTGFTVTSGGTGYGASQPFAVKALGGITAGTAGAVVNPAIGPGRLSVREATIVGTSSAGGAIVNTGLTIADAGLFSAIPLLFVLVGGNGLPTVTATLTATVGGIPTLTVIQPFA